MSRFFRVRGLLRGGLAAVSLALTACSGGGGGSGSSERPGSEIAKPGGGTFFLDPHQGGRGTRLRLVECVWGRLVDVHGLDAAGNLDPQPAFQDLLILETIQSDGLDYRLETNAITQRTRLVILRRRGAPNGGDGTFEDLLARARAQLPPVLPEPDDGSSSGPFSLVARNACLSLRCDDLLQDGPAAREALRTTVRLLTGYPPSLPFEARVLFDPNHGGIADGAFHSTRILVDLTVSEEEATSAEQPLPVNSIGLPASLLGDARASASVHIPSRKDPGSGLFDVLTNLAGAAMSENGNGPIDRQSPTRDVVRGFRAGRSDDANSGFLLDLNPPRLIGSWPVLIRSARLDPGGDPARDFLLDLTFGVCRRGPRAGDIIQAGERFLEVRLPRNDPDPSGEVDDVPVQRVGGEALVDVSELQGSGEYLSTFADGLFIPRACWATVTPLPGEPPAGELSAQSQFAVRFTEPMNPVSVEPFDNLRLVKGNPSVPVNATNIVVAEVTGSSDLRRFTLRPLVPLGFGASGDYHLDLKSSTNGLRDLAGNAVASAPGPIEYHLASGQPVPESGSVVFRFDSTDEVEPIGSVDLRGQIFYDFERGTIRGRQPILESFAADRTQPVPSIMIPFAPGVQTPLSGLGSKLQTVWRHCDLGWTVEDESKHNLDVIGLSWTPVGGNVLNDFFERFELRLAHSRRLPDEFRTFVGTIYPCSGLGAGENICPPCPTFVPFEDNILRDPRSPQKIVHDRSRGYRIDTRDLYLGVSGVPLMPWPMNRGGDPFTSFTWRDTAVLAKDGSDSGGIPLLIETGPPLQVVPGPAGRIAVGGQVPAWGLPLLIEVRCFPSSTALGLNPVEIYLAQNAQALPCFRAYSTGGTNESGQAVRIDPDQNLIPAGGFNPGSRPPGKPTIFQADNSFYAGELSTIVRVSRAHSIWLQVGLGESHFLPVVTSPRPGEQPGNTRVEIDFRGADGFTGAGLQDAFDARQMDPLGDIGDLDVQFHDDERSWTSSIEHLDGSAYLQVRFSFVNDIVALIRPELSALGIAFQSR